MASPIPRLGASLPLPPDLDMCRRVAEHAEILGYESLWIADTGAGPDAFVVAAVARRGGSSWCARSSPRS